MLVFKNSLLVIFVLILLTGCGSSGPTLEINPEIAAIANISILAEGDLIQGVIEPKGEFPKFKYIIFQCFDGDKMIWRAGYLLTNLLEKAPDKKRIVCSIVKRTHAAKAGDVSAVKVVLVSSL